MNSDMIIDKTIIPNLNEMLLTNKCTDKTQLEGIYDKLRKDKVYDSKIPLKNSGGINIFININLKEKYALSKINGLADDFYEKSKDML